MKRSEKVNSLRQRLPIYIGILVMIFVIIFLVRACTHRQVEFADTTPPGGDTLAVAIEISPLSYSMSSDTARGLDYDILCDICARHGRPVRFYPFTSLPEAYAALEEGHYDLLVASIPATGELRQRLRLTNGVYLDKQILVRRKVSAETDSIAFPQARLLGDTVWIPKGSPVAGRIRNLAAESGGEIEIVEVPDASPEHLTILTALGDIRQAVVNEGIARKIASDYPQLDVSVPLSFNQLQAWAVAPRDSVLADSLDAWVVQFQQTPQYQALLKKYLE